LRKAARKSGESSSKTYPIQIGGSTVIKSQRVYWVVEVTVKVEDAGTWTRREIRTSTEPYEADESIEVWDGPFDDYQTAFQNS
jgi:NOL1/NOP2/fmu family ribosome biogenesis protein